MALEGKSGVLKTGPSILPLNYSRSDFLQFPTENIGLRGQNCKVEAQHSNLMTNGISPLFGPIEFRRKFITAELQQGKKQLNLDDLRLRKPQVVGSNPTLAPTMTRLSFVC